jgi:hypothetical protein
MDSSQEISLLIAPGDIVSIRPRMMIRTDPLDQIASTS